MRDKSGAASNTVTAAANSAKPNNFKNSLSRAATSSRLPASQSWLRCGMIIVLSMAAIETSSRGTTREL